MGSISRIRFGNLPARHRNGRFSRKSKPATEQMREGGQRAALLHVQPLASPAAAVVGSGTCSAGLRTSKAS
jgi:hypothetical protein